MTSWLKGGNARFLPKGQLSSEETEEFVRKKADVRDRLVHQVKAKKGIKKGFLNPERKRKLRELLFKKAAEDMKAEQERKAQERRRILEERIGHDKHSALNDAKALGEVCRQYYERVLKLVESSYDLEVKVRVKDYEINEMTIQVNDLRGKFVKPTLNKVKRAESQTQKMEKIKNEHGQALQYRKSLKSSGISKFAMDDESKIAKTKHDWTAKDKEQDAI